MVSHKKEKVRYKTKILCSTCCRLTSPYLLHSSQSQNLSRPSLLNPFAGFTTPVSMVSSPIMAVPPSLRPPPHVSTQVTQSSSSSLPSTPTGDVCAHSRSSADGGGPVRRRVSDKCNIPISAGTDIFYHLFLSLFGWFICAVSFSLMSPVFFLLHR